MDRPGSRQPDGSPAFLRRFRGDVKADSALLPADPAASTLELVVADPFCPHKLDADSIKVTVLEKEDTVTLKVAVPDNNDGSNCGAPIPVG